MKNSLNKKLKKGYTLVETLVSLCVIAVVSSISIGISLNIVNNNKNSQRKENVNSLIDAYHSWYSDSAKEIREITAEESIYSFVTNDGNGVSSYGFDSLLFNYEFIDRESSDGSIKKECHLYFTASDYAVSIDLDVFSSGLETSAGRLLYTESPTISIYTDFNSLLSERQIDESDLLLAKYTEDGKTYLGRKGREISIQSSSKLLPDYLYVLNGQSIISNSYNPINYYNNANVLSTVYLKDKDGNPILNPLSIKYDITSTMKPVKIVKDVKLEGYSTFGNVVVYGDTENYTFDDNSLPNLANTACVVKYFRAETQVTETWTSTIYEERKLDWGHYTDWKSDDGWGDFSCSTSEKTLDGSWFVHSFDSLNEAREFVYSPLSNDYDKGNTIYSSQWDTKNTNKYYNTKSAESYSSYYGPWYDKAMTHNRYRDKTYTMKYEKVSYNHDYFQMFVGTSTLTQDFKVPTDFNFIINFNFDANKDYSHTGAGQIYKENVNAFSSHREYNKLTINQGVTLDASDAGYVKVGGLMLPGFNNKDNVGAYSTIENNGVLIVDQLEVLGYVTGTGIIKTDNQSKIWERSSILDYANDANSVVSMMSKEFGWVRYDNSAFQKAVAWNWGAAYFDSAYSPTKKSNSGALFNKYDSSAISCELEIHSGTEYTQKYFTDYGFNLSSSTNIDVINNCVIDYHLFGNVYNYSSADEGKKQDAKTNSSIFQISNSGTVIKSINKAKQMVFSTSDANVVNNENYCFKFYDKYLSSDNYLTACGSFMPTILYNTVFNFSKNSSLAVNCADLWVMPSSELNFIDNSKLTLGTANVKGYADNIAISKSYDDAGRIIVLSRSDLSMYSDPSFVENSSDILAMSFSGLSDGSLYVADTASVYYNNDSNMIFGNINSRNFGKTGTFEYGLTYYSGWGRSKFQLRTLSISSNFIG